MDEPLPPDSDNRTLAVAADAGDAATERIIALTAALTTMYLVSAVVPMVRHAALTHQALPLVGHLLALAIAVSSIANARRSRLLGVVRDWLPLALGPFLYVELRWLIVGGGHASGEALVLSWEALFFPSAPSRTLALRFADVRLSEALHAAYAAYYLIVYLPALRLYATERRRAFAVTLLSLGITYASCFIIFVIFPVDGPRFLVGPAATPVGPIRDAVLRLLETASSRGTAFPSSHVAASVAATICALRFQPVVGYPVALLTAALAVATVYGGFHYGVDAVAGLVMGSVATVVAFLIARSIERPSQSATAP